MLAGKFPQRGAQAFQRSLPGCVEPGLRVLVRLADFVHHPAALPRAGREQFSGAGNHREDHVDEQSADNQRTERAAIAEAREFWEIAGEGIPEPAVRERQQQIADDEKRNHFHPRPRHVRQPRHRHPGASRSDCEKRNRETKNCRPASVGGRHLIKA